MKIAVVGAGTVGTALAVRWSRSGHAIVAVSGRNDTRARAERFLPGVPVLDHAAAAAAGELVLLAVPDDAIAAACAQIAGSVKAGSVVAHVSGALGLEVLEPAVRAGARPLALHPLQTFPDVEAAIASLPGSTIAVTAEDEPTALLAERLVADVGATPARLRQEQRALYHAAAVFASNYLVVVSALAEDLFERAGLEGALDRYLPLTRTTLDNVERLGHERALTGPAVRGDAGTIRRNLEALAAAAPDAIPAYVALARVALDLGERSGRSSPTDRAAIEEVLERWS